MKTNAILTAIVMMSVIFTSCTKEDQFVTPSGKVTTQTKALSGFTTLEVEDAFTVYVTFSDIDEQVVVEANENLQQYIHVEKISDRLIIRMDKHISLRRGQAVLKIYVTASKITEYKASGATNIYLQNTLNEQHADIHLSGASRLEGNFQVSDLNANLSGASNLSLQGEAAHFDVDLSGASVMEDFDFQVQLLDAQLDGASHASLTVAQRLDVKASGGSTVFYKGNGTIGQQDLSGASRIVWLD